MFERPHHQRIAHILDALDGSLLTHLGCYFGGGTCISLRFGEFRESVDIDFLTDDADGYRELRQRLSSTDGLNALLRAGARLLRTRGDMRIDQYGIRTRIEMDGAAIRFEVVREARITLEAPGDKDAVCGIPTLTIGDLATSKLLANSDRHADDGVFSRDLIDIAMMQLRLPILRSALEKASGAYGKAVARDLELAISRMQLRQGWLDRCMHAMDIRVPKALLWQRIRALRRVLVPAQVRD
ncbi:MAG: nucleotidyl transferase AbiEii/AbiGii toxin family protein [Ahniella sp.]|nr:nucleotidyl transferase AbiEii/AbiGii toxin family protein [Ahniella sp.]